MAKEKDVLDTDAAQKPLETIAEALLEIGETLESILALIQEREAGFKARNARTAASYGDRPSYGDRSSYGDRKPYERKSYGSRDDASSGDDEGAERKPYARKSYGDKPAYGDKPKRSYGDKPAYGEKKSFGGAKRSFGAEKKPYKPRVARDDAGAEATPRKKYKGGY